MASSSSRRARRDGRSESKHRSRSSSQSSDGSGYSAPTYMVEENSRGELVNKRMGVEWPTRVHHARRYPDYSSSSSSATSSVDQFASSPYEMLSLADLDAAIAAAANIESRSSTSSASSSSQSVSQSELCRIYAEEASWLEDQPTTQIDSVVFDTVEEMNRYQRLFRNAGGARSATSVASSTVMLGDSEETNRHFIGMRSRRAVDRKLKPGEFFMYYDKPSGVEIPVTIELKIGFMSSTNKTYHFPIHRYECEGEPYYVVMQTETDVQMFPSITELVQHYLTFSHVDPEPSRLESFASQPV